MDDNLRIWRTFQLGNLVDLIMLDTRQYDRSITDMYFNTEYIYDIKDDASRSLMGSRQENWLQHKLINSAKRGAHWRLIGSQIGMFFSVALAVTFLLKPSLVFSQLNESTLYGSEMPFNVDSWDGYLASKNRTLQTLYENNIGNNIMLSGDSHANWVSDLTWLDHSPYNPHNGAGSIGVEFGGTAVTSPSPFGENITISAANDVSKHVVQDTESLLWSEGYYRGYYELQITAEQVQAQFFGIPNIKDRAPGEVSLANFTVMSGNNRLERNSNNQVAGGSVANGYLKYGETDRTDLVYNTETGQYHKA